MPINNYQSLCKKDAECIVSRDVGRTEHRGSKNPLRRYVMHYRVDGVIIKEGSRCDFILMNEYDKKAYLIELKGSSLSYAAKQIAATKDSLKEYLKNYTLHYRIVTSRSKIQQIESADFKRYREHWNSSLLYKTNKIEEEI